MKNSVGKIVNQIALFALAFMLNGCLESATLNQSSINISTTPPSIVAPTTLPLQGTTGTLTKNLSAGFFGTNIENQFGGGPFSWSDPNLSPALSTLQFTSLRFPGGAVSNYWDWQNNETYDLLPTSDANDTLANFATIANAAHATPVFCLNLMTYQNAVLTAPASSSIISNQIAMLQQAQTLGLPIKMIEFGNEFYLGSSSSTASATEKQYYERFPSGSAYGNEVNRWSKQVKAAYPNAKIAAVGADYSGGWNQALLPILTTGAQGVDAITYHRYDGIDDSTNANDLPAIFATAFSRWSGQKSQIDYFASFGLSTWVTEFDLVDHSSDLHFASTWMHGLYSAIMEMHFLTDPNVSQTSIYNLHSPSKIFSLVYSGSESFGTPAQKPTQNALSAVGNTMKLFGQVLSGASKIEPVTFGNLPMVSPSGDETFTAYPALLAVKVEYPSASPQFLVLNLSSQSYSLQLGSGNATINSVYTQSLGTYVLNAESLTSKTASIALFNFKVPAFSINRVY